MTDSTTKEQYYDEHVAPKLAEIGKECEARGLSLIAACEWEPGEFGSTVTLTDASYAMRLVNSAIMSLGNVDTLLIAISKHATKHGHSSIFLKQLGIPTVPTKTDE